MSVTIERSDALGDAVLMIRRRVFIDEQGIPEADELDGTDDGCIHFLLSEDGAPLATLRLMLVGELAKIGRVATLPQGRGRGFAARLMQTALDEARAQGFRSAYLSAQEDVIPWYERFAFKAEGPAYDDGGIPHRDMRREL